ncbi:MAG: ParA family protein [Candidatus Absconditicoccaceae bacterium]
MDIKPTQKVVFINNKGGVGKTTLSYNVACKLGDKGHKTLLIDADPQCNMTFLSLGKMRYTELGLFGGDTIYRVFERIIQGSGDIQIVQPINIRPNLDLLPGHLSFGDVDDILTTSYGEILSSVSSSRGFMVTSAFQRYINEISLKNNYDIVLIDVSPSMTGSLNKTILLSVDFFATICNPDLFSKQGIVNLGDKILTWKRERKNMELIAARSQNIPFQNMLTDNLTYMGYIVNEFNVYKDEVISDHDMWIKDMGKDLRRISLELSRNGLIDLSANSPIGMTQDYSRIAAMGQQQHKPMYEFNDEDVGAKGSIELLHKCKDQMEELAHEFIERISHWGR